MTLCGGESLGRLVETLVTYYNFLGQEPSFETLAPLCPVTCVTDMTLKLLTLEDSAAATGPRSRGDIGFG